MHPAAEAPPAPTQPDHALREDMRYLLTRVVRHLRKPGPHPALAEQILAFMPRHGMAFSPLRAEAPAEPTEPAALNIADPAAAAPGTSAYRAQLRDLVDRVWGRAMEDTSVPSTTMADEIIEQWEASLSTTSTVALTEDAIITEDESGAEVQAARTARVVPSASASGREASLDPAVLSDVLAGMLQGIENDAEQLGAAIAHEPAFADALESARNRRPSHFHLQLIYPQEKVCQAVLNAAGIPPKARWLFQNYQFAKLHVQRIIEMREGSQCCVDKARTILSAWLRFELTGVPIAFDYAGEYTFHLPTTVLSTHEEIVSFCEGLRRLHAGRPDQYLTSLRQLLAPAAGVSSGAQPQ
ncbi:hypothetical protein [uncultured Variovorax sp.]|uniref:hypothetical protein n=1 Tax=uncultured Variovorax sp. TaxID=114708 RepID=UPI00260DC99A|nr:hypothetical protein [uncultured Variovorax sp.]